MFYFDILDEFYKNKIKYLVVGGLSLNLHGIPRTTQDIDIILSLDKTNINLTIKILTKLNYIPKLPVPVSEFIDENKRKEWIDQKNLKAFSFYNKNDNYKVVDILLVHPLDFNKSYKNKITKNVSGIEIYIVNIDDLIVMKKYSGRNQDISDIKLLEKYKNFLENNK